MAVGNIYVFAFFTALVAVNLIFAEENPLESNFFDQVDVGDEADREERSPNDGDEVQDRFFFNLFPTFTTCNYTAQAGATCRSCRQALRCLPSNVGILRVCRGITYCNNGYCSLFPGSLCNSTG